MAGRVNTKFVFVLSAVIIFLVAVLAAVYYKTVLNSASQNAIAGDEFVAENEYFLALEKYGSAHIKDPLNPTYIEKYLSLFPKLKIETSVEARKYLGQERTARKRLAELPQETTDAQIAYYKLLFSYTDLYGSQSTAGILHSESDEWLVNHPNDVIAKKYRGIASTLQLNINMSDSDLEQTYNDLDVAAQAFPKDADIPYFIANYLLFRSAVLDTDSGDRELAAQFRDAAKQHADQLYELINDDTTHLIRYANLIINPQFNPAIPVNSSEDFIKQVQDSYKARVASVKPIVDRLEQKAINGEITNEFDLYKISNLLRRTDTEFIKQDGAIVSTQGIHRATKMLEAVLEKKPNSIMIYRELGNLYRLENNTDRALYCFNKAMDSQNINTALIFLRNTSIQIEAAKNAGELYIVKSATTDDQSEKDQAFAKVEKIISYINKRDGAQIYEKVLQAKLLYAQDKFAEAAPILEECYKKLKTSDLQLMQMTADSRLKQGNWGAATTIYEEYLAQRPGDIRILLTLARLYTQHKQPEKARPIINMLLENDSTNRSTLLLHATVLAYENKIDEAIEIYQSLDPVKTPSLYQMLIQLYMAKKDTASAKDAALKFFEADPSNITALQTALNFADSDSEKSQLILIAKESGADERTINLIADKQAGNLANLDAAALASRINEGVEDPFTKLINEIQVYARSNEMEPLKAAIAKAAELKPNHPDVLKLQFNLALTEKNYDAAEEAVAKIAELNIDKAQGNTYRARLATAKGEFDLAEAAYSRALAAIEIDSDLWVKYGQTLVYNKKITEAEEAFRKAIQQKPDNVNAYRGLATTFLQTNRGEDALKQIKIARQYEPRNAEILNIYLQLEQQFGDKELATKLREQIAQAAPQDNNNRRTLAALYADAGRFDEAIDLIHQIIKDEGETQINMIALAQTYALSGKPDQGETTIRQYIAGLIDKATVNDYLILARYLTQQSNDSQRILAAYQEAINHEDASKRTASRELADLLFSRRQYPQSAELYKSIVESDPTDSRVSLRLAETYIKINEYDKASEVLKDFDPESAEMGAAESLVLRAMIVMNQKKYDEAIKLMNQAIRNDRDNGRLYYQRARMLSMLPDRINDAIKDYNRAIENVPNLTIARRELAQLHLRRGYKDEAVRELENLIALYPQDNLGRLQLIKILQADNKIVEAKGIIDEAIANNPEEPEWHSMLGNLEAARGNFKAAVDAKMAAFDLAPNDQALTQIGELIFRADRPDKLLEIYDTYSKYAGNMLAKAQKGRAYIMLDDKATGEKLFDQAFEECQNFGQLAVISAQAKLALGEDYLNNKLLNQSLVEKKAWGQLIIAEAAVNKKDYATAINNINDVLSILQGDLKLRAQRMLASATYLAGDFTASKNTYEAILEELPNDLGTLNNLAYLLAEDLNSPEPALPLAQKAFELAPNNPQILDTYGWVLYTAGKTEDARSILEQSIQLQPLPPALYHLGVVYNKLEKQVDAINMLKQAVELANKMNNKDIAQQAESLLNELNK